MQAVSKFFKEKVNSYSKIFCICFVYAVALYSLLMTHNLTNSVDGLWEGSFYKAGRWEISCGRWFWPVIDRLRGGISVDPITSIIALLIFLVSMIVIVDIFEVKKKIANYLAVLLLISSVIVCVSLSYRYMSITFALSFLFASVAAWIVKVFSENVKISKLVLSIFLAACFITLQMGLYQADIGVYLLLLLGIVTVLIYKGAELKRILRFISCGFLSLFFGMLGYVIVLKVSLLVTHVSMSTYNGGSTYGLANTIREFRWRFKDSYWYFSKYYFEGIIKHSFFCNYNFSLWPILLVLFAVSLFVLALIKKNSKRLIGLVLWIFLPVVLYAIIFISTGVVMSVQMTAGYCLLPSVMILVLFAIADDSGICERIIRGGAVLLFSVVLYGGTLQVITDQHAMDLGKNASMAVAHVIFDEVLDEGLYNADYTYCITSSSSTSVVFDVPKEYNMANHYAMYGGWWTSSGSRSWKGIYRDLGLNLNIGDNVLTLRTTETEQFEKMPVFPEKGSIALSEDFENTVIIRLE